MLIIILFGLAFVTFKVINGANKSSKNRYENIVSEISPSNYTNVLKKVHSNIDSYIGKKIKFSGYVYRVLDLEDNQFILARDMIINSQNQSVVVGFLCEYDDAKNLENNQWVEITGEIYKGNYHGDMPIVKIQSLTKIDKAQTDEYVFPPSDDYIPTTSII